MLWLRCVADIGKLGWYLVDCKDSLLYVGGGLHADDSLYCLHTAWVNTAELRKINAFWRLCLGRILGSLLFHISRIPICTVLDILRQFFTTTHVSSAWCKAVVRFPRQSFYSLPFPIASSTRKTSGFQSVEHGVGFSRRMRNLNRLYKPLQPNLSNHQSLRRVLLREGLSSKNA